MILYVKSRFFFIARGIQLDNGVDSPCKHAHMGYYFELYHITYTHATQTKTRSHVHVWRTFKACSTFVLIRECYQTSKHKCVNFIVAYVEVGGSRIFKSVCSSVN